MNQKEYEKRLKWQKNWQKKQRQSQIKYSKKKKMSKKKKTRKYKKKSPRQKLVEKIDELWSLKVRDVCKCELCDKGGGIKSFDAHHMKGRGRMTTRWYIPNGVCLHKGCHKWKVHTDTLVAGILLDKLKKKRGKDWWDKLVKRAERQTKLYIQDLRDIKALAEQDKWNEIDKIIEKNYI